MLRCSEKKKKKSLRNSKLQQQVCATITSQYIHRITACNFIKKDCITKAFLNISLYLQISYFSKHSGQLVLKFNWFMTNASYRNQSIDLQFNQMIPAMGTLSLQIHLMLLFSSYIPWKHQKSLVLLFLGGIEKDPWYEMG